MKKNLIIILLFTLCHTCFSQDLIIKRNGEEVIGKVYEISGDSIKYLLPDTISVTSQSLLKKEVFMIKYQSGLKEVFEEKSREVTSKAPTDFEAKVSNADLFERGYTDGRVFYKNRGNFWGPFAIGVITPYTYWVPGLVINTAIGATPPNERTLQFHDTRYGLNAYSKSTEISDLFRNPMYRKGYKKGAHKRKVGTVASGTGAGAATGIGVALLIVLALFSTI